MTPKSEEMTDQTAANIATNTELLTVAASISLPAFWPSRIQLWFAMAEAKFDLAHPKITQEQTKFNHVLTVLSPEIADEVADLITKPDASEPYTKLKEAIISRTTLSESQKLKQLLSGEELGSRKPSQLLRHMRQLINDSGYVNDQVLKELFMQQMPVSVKQILVSLSGVTLESIAEVADRILETTPAIAAVSHWESKKPLQDAVDPIAILTKKFDSLLQRLDGLERNEGRWKRNTSRNRSRTRSPAPERHQTCWYHYKFGEKAKKCVSPCNYSTQKNEMGM